MGQVTFYLDDGLEQQMNELLQEQNQAPHIWLAEAVKQKLNNGWSAETLNLVGSWADFPELEEIRQTLGDDIPREEM